MLEKMGEFFDKRLNEYEEHQLNCIDLAHEFLHIPPGVFPMHLVYRY